MRITRLLFVSLFAAAFLAHGGQTTALDRYVAAPDPAYRYEFVHAVKGSRNTAFVLDMVSQS